MRSVSIREQTTTISNVANPFIFYFCIISTVFQLLYGKNSSKKTIESSNQAHNTRKTESVKNRTVCSNLATSNTSVTPKILKNQDNVRNLYINLLQKEFVFYHAFVKNENYFRESKIFCFSARIQDLKHQEKEAKTHITQDAPSKTHNI